MAGRDAIPVTILGPAQQIATVGQGSDAGAIDRTKTIGYRNHLTLRGECAVVMLNIDVSVISPGDDIAVGDRSDREVGVIGRLLDAMQQLITGVGRSAAVGFEAPHVIVGGVLEEAPFIPALEAFDAPTHPKAAPLLGQDARIVGKRGIYVAIDFDCSSGGGGAIAVVNPTFQICGLTDGYTVVDSLAPRHYVLAVTQDGGFGVFQFGVAAGDSDLAATCFAAGIELLGVHGVVRGRSFCEAVIGGPGEHEAAVSQRGNAWIIDPLHGDRGFLQ